MVEFTLSEDMMEALGLNSPSIQARSHCAVGRLASVERYDPVFDSWQIVTAMQHKRGNLAAAVLNNQVYVVGGYDGHTYHSSVERYDIYSTKFIVTHDSVA